MTQQPSRPSLSEKYDAAERLLHAQQIEAALSELQVAEALEKISKFRNARVRHGLSLMLFVAALVIVTIGMLVRIGSAEIDIWVKATGIEVISAADAPPVLTSGHVESAGIGIDKVEYFSSIPPELADRFQRSSATPVTGDVSIEAERITLEKLALVPGNGNALIITEFRDGNAHVRVENARLEGTLVISNPTAFESESQIALSALTEDGISGRDPEKFFKTGEYGDGAISNSLQFFELNSLRMEVNDLVSARFEREYPPGSGLSQSTIVAGYVRLLDTAEEITLRAGEYLSIQCIACERNLLLSENGQLSFALRGTASRIAGGYENDLKNFTPTLVEYIYHNKKLAMVWTAAFFIFGLLVNVRQYLK